MKLCTNHVDKCGGRGVAQMSTLLNKSYLVNVSKKGGGSKKPKILSTWFVHNPYDKLYKVSFEVCMILNS